MACSELSIQPHPVVGVTHLAASWLWAESMTEKENELTPTRINPLPWPRWHNAQMGVFSHQSHAVHAYLSTLSLLPRRVSTQVETNPHVVNTETQPLLPFASPHH